MPFDNDHWFDNPGGCPELAAARRETLSVDPVGREERRAKIVTIR